MHFKQFHCGKTFAQVLTILARNSDKILFQQNQYLGLSHISATYIFQSCCTQIKMLFYLNNFPTCFLTHWFPMHPFSTPLKTSENRKVMLYN